MNVGMLWFDADEVTTLREKISRAAEYYQAKYGRRPNICFAHPGTLGEGFPDHAGGMNIRSSVSVLPNHFWLGIKERELQARKVQLREAA
jgi:hypothetical protein